MYAWDNFHSYLLLPFYSKAFEIFIPYNRFILILCWFWFWFPVLGLNLYNFGGSIEGFSFSKFDLTIDPTEHFKCSVGIAKIDLFDHAGPVFHLVQFKVVNDLFYLEIYARIWFTLFSIICDHHWQSLEFSPLAEDPIK